MLCLISWLSSGLWCQGHAAPNAPTNLLELQVKGITVDPEGEAAPVFARIAGAGALSAIAEDGGSRVEIHAVRHLRGRGWLLAPFFLPLPVVSAASSVHGHLRHFLGNIDGPDPESVDET